MRCDRLVAGCRVFGIEGAQSDKSSCLRITWTPGLQQVLTIGTFGIEIWVGGRGGISDSGLGGNLLLTCDMENILPEGCDSLLYSETDGSKISVKNSYLRTTVILSKQGWRSTGERSREPQEGSHNGRDIRFSNCSECR